MDRPRAPYLIVAPNVLQGYDGYKWMLEVHWYQDGTCTSPLKAFKQKATAERALRAILKNSSPS